jgi:hypothetical protein
MIEVYAFVAMFALQILTMSVLHPAMLIRYSQRKAPEFPAERFPLLYAGIFRHLSAERFPSLYRAVNAVIAVLGFALLGWLFGDMRDADWSASRAIVLTVAYFVTQFMPLAVLALMGLRYVSVLRSAAQEGKRKAVLERRGLFDFVSPFVVLIAVAVYLAFVAFMIYVIHFRETPFRGAAGYMILGVVTLSYLLSGGWIYKTLYGRKLNPFESHQDRVRTMGLGIRATIYTGIATDVYLPIFFTLMLVNLNAWLPLAQSALFVVFALLICIPFVALSRPAEGKLSSSPTS